MANRVTITPITAASLLDLEVPSGDALREGENPQDPVRGLRRSSSFRTGIASLDAELSPSDPDSTAQRGRGLWMSGRVIGLGGVSGGGSENGTEQNARLVPSPSLPLEIIATHLTGTISAKQTTTNPLSSGDLSQVCSVFIITPPPLLSNSMQRLYLLLVQQIRDQKNRQRYPRTHDQTRLVAADTALLARKADESADIEKQAETLLDRVSVLQYLDIPGLLESISEVRNAVASPAAVQTPHGSQGAIILLLGLSQTLNSTNARYGLVRTAALLSGVLGGLRDLSNSVRSNPQAARSQSPLVLVDLEIVYISPTSSGSGNPAAGGRHGSGNAGLETAFASQMGKVMHIVPVGVLGRLIERAMDAVVAVHDGNGKINVAVERRRIVEVVHDGSGDLFGRWAVWNTG